MKLPFEVWLDNQRFPLLPSSLFKEAVLCYKAGAYRSSIIMSYLALQNVVRQRILQAAKPSNIVQYKWDASLRELRNDDKWDEATLNCVQSEATDNTVFSLSKDVREQYKYWKNRRNDAAHTKNNEITQSHLETFWWFIISNLNKVVVIGSELEIINRIKDHFDITKTPPSKTYQPLIDEIPLSINMANAQDFFEKLDQALKSSKSAKTNRNRFWAKVLNTRQDVASEAYAYIKSDKELVSSILKIDHSKSVYLSEEQYIREIWQKFIFDEYSKYEFVLFVYFINNIIPQGEKEDARNKFILSLLQASKVYPYLLDEIEVKSELRQDYYKNKIRSIILDKLDFIYPGTYYSFWGTEYSDFVVFYLKEFGVDFELAKKIHDTFIKSKYPYGLQTTLRDLFVEKPQILESIKALLSEQSITVSSRIEPAVVSSPLPPPLPLSPPPPPLPPPSPPTI